ncbi:MAG: C4-dicarboxylate ABC transporter [Acidobacteria bacterium]|nr:C4-dicarboxylate ABC transporter [Acidobacteriota bacterium]
MNLGWLSLGALALAVTLSCFTRLNVGLLAAAMAWILGVYVAGKPVKEVVAGFPVDLFLTLAGVSLLFSQATVNGTLERLSRRAVGLCQGRAGLIPVLFFALGAVLASCGPGNIATAGLLSPVAMATATRSGIPPFLMAIMVGNGANAGSLSPLAPTGLIANGLMARISLSGHSLEIWLYNVLAHALVAFGGYLAFGGVALLRRNDRVAAQEAEANLTRTHWTTIAVIAGLVLSVVALKVHIGLASFTAAVLLSLLRAADEEEAIRRMPWGTILMVCGVSILIALLEKTAGLEIFSGLIASVSTPETVIPLLAAMIGLISAYSSTSGVVLPAFLPLIPSLIAKLGGGDALGIALTMCVAGHLVDVSPLSTIGALCVAAVPVAESRRLFNQLLVWGLSMTVAGALLSWLLFQILL